MKPTFNESQNSTSNPLPISMRFARAMEVPDPSPIPYDPKTQMSIYGGDTMKMMGRDKSTCSVSSSTKESIVYGGNADSDRKADD
jgi:hypothetical protein